MRKTGCTYTLTQEEVSPKQTRSKESRSFTPLAGHAEMSDGDQKDEDVGWTDDCFRTVTLEDHMQVETLHKWSSL